MNKRLHYALILVGLSSLLLEVTLIRILSVSLWYPFAYFSISSALLGLGLAAVLLSSVPALQRWSAHQALPWSAAGFSVSTTIGFMIWNQLPLAPMSLLVDHLQILWLLLLLILLTIPFVFTGFFVAKIFSTWTQAAGKWYAADLGGGALGVVLYVVLLPQVGAPALILLASALAGLAALLLYPRSYSIQILLALWITFMVGAMSEIDNWLILHISPNKFMGTPEAQTLPRHLVWNLSSTIDVIDPDPSSEFLLFIIDGGTAFTRAYKRSHHKVPPFSQNLRGLPYRLVSGRNTLIIGSGGGVEVSAALGADAKRIVALEMDPAINRLVTNRFNRQIGAIFRYPSVELITTEARSYLASHPERFDVVAAFHTISNSASSTGAMSLAENYLHTQEALALILSRLTADGVFIMSRPEAQLGRLCATLKAAWPEDRDDLSRHVAIITQHKHQPDFLAALLYKNKALTQQDMKRVHQHTPGRIAFLPDGSGDSQSFFQAALKWSPTSIPDIQEKVSEAKLSYHPLSIQPTTDNRPFFNLNQAWSDITLSDFGQIFSGQQHARALLENMPIGQVVIVILIIELLLLAGLFIIPPVYCLKKQKQTLGPIFLLAIVFSGLGYGYMCTEIVLIQSLTRIIGMPSWSMLTTLSLLLAASGVGSWILVNHYRWSPRRSIIAAVVTVSLSMLVIPYIVDIAAPWPHWERIILASISVFGIGFFLGTPFAATMRELKQDVVIAWAWALNSFFSVAGSVLTLLIASTWGFRFASTTAAVAYLLTLIAWLVMLKRKKNEQHYSHDIL